ncbi:outer membrane protein assembly factor BamD [Candidatus Pelagibacter sp.]|nr:outer membrane protein assembly factor BamD [Candidatus Pelagibacter sp.]
MSKYKIIFILISSVIITACSSDDQNIKLIKETNQKEEMISSYKAGVELLEISDYFAASKKFLEAEILFPQSKWAPKSVLMASYSYFLQGYYTLAIENIKRYLKTYPKDKNKPYAHYLLAECIWYSYEYS